MSSLFRYYQVHLLDWLSLLWFSLSLALTMVNTYVFHAMCKFVTRWIVLKIQLTCILRILDQGRLYHCIYRYRSNNLPYKQHREYLILQFLVYPILFLSPVIDVQTRRPTEYVDLFFSYWSHWQTPAADHPWLLKCLMYLLFISSITFPNHFINHLLHATGDLWND